MNDKQLIVSDYPEDILFILSLKEADTEPILNRTVGERLLDGHTACSKMNVSQHQM